MLGHRQPHRSYLQADQKQADKKQADQNMSLAQSRQLTPSVPQRELALAKMKGVKISFNRIEISFDDGTRLSAPLDQYPYSRNAKADDRAKWEAMRWWAWSHLAKMRQAKIHRYRISRSRLNALSTGHDHIKH